MLKTKSLWPWELILRHLDGLWQQLTLTTTSSGPQLKRWLLFLERLSLFTPTRLMRQLPCQPNSRLELPEIRNWLFKKKPAFLMWWIRGPEATWWRLSLRSSPTKQHSSSLRKREVAFQRAWTITESRAYQRNSKIIYNTIKRLLIVIL